MKRNRSLYIQFEKWAAFKARTQTALKTRQVSIGEKSVVLFNSVVDYQKFMTEQKIAILAAIISQRPSSIYQLAQVLERDFGNVQRDCTALEAMGFIVLEKTGGKNGSKAPKLAFDYRRIVIKMPKVTYCHDLDLAA
jgi:hypothetical protein